MKLVFTMIIVGVWLCPAFGWWGNGHALLTHAAVRILPDSFPHFFSAGESAIAHCSIDPDLARNPLTPHASRALSPDHFCDREMFGSTPLPEDCYAFIAECYQKKIKPEQVGFLPYSIMENTERLAVAFAEYRKWPNDTLVMQKCFVYAGLLAHFSEDLCQPLHCTIHYDGKVVGTGGSPHSGIHGVLDGLIEMAFTNTDSLCIGLSSQTIDSLPRFVFDAIKRSNQLVDTVYVLEKQLQWEKGKPLSLSANLFARTHGRRAAQTTALLFVYAWKLSASLQLEPWLDRKKSDALQE